MPLFTRSGIVNHDFPNAVIENPRNGHAQAIWTLKAPLTRTEYARRAPLAFAAAVTEGPRCSVDGDQAYSGLITKNLTHEAWEPHWLTDHLYELVALREHLDGSGFMPPASWTRTRQKKLVGLDRGSHLSPWLEDTEQAGIGKIRDEGVAAFFTTAQRAQ